MVGTRCYYSNYKTHNAGIVIGEKIGAKYLFEGLEKAEDGYFGNEKIIQNLSAVSNFCMMIKGSIFNKIGGISNEFSGILNSADMCLKVRALGKLVVYNPTIEVIVPEEKNNISNDELNRFCEKWREKIDKKDEYYNPNFSLKSADCEVMVDFQDVGEKEKQK